ncbi:hypothetical protein ACQP1W_19005 [Spirillospora sp. CA-255316]
MGRRKSESAGEALEYCITTPADDYYLPRDSWIRLGDDMVKALAQAMERLEAPDTGSLSFIAAPVKGWGSADRATVYRIQDGVALVVGDRLLGRFQTQIRAALDRGDITGWSHLAPTEPEIPLKDVESRLGGRVYNRLAGLGFETLNQVLAVPEHTLRRQRNVGAHFLEKLRQFRDTESPVVRVAHARPVRQQPHHVDLIRQRMSTASLHRYGNLVQPLGQCNLPESALNTIIDALNAEPLPPADPTVVQFLRDADESDLLNAYLRTHEAGPEAATSIEDASPTAAPGPPGTPDRP